MMVRSDLGDLAAFAVVASERSFTHTATEMRLSTSALSYVIKELEARLGIRPLQRKSRSASVTEADRRAGDDVPVGQKRESVLSAAPESDNCAIS